jgi:tRNA pseudouridine55 synthase
VTDRGAERASVHGVVVVDKPSGLTSFDVVARARRHFGTRRVGHAGTLDPMATGVLLVLLGEATKLADALSGAHKTYEAEVSFGRSTDTLDALGQTVHEAEVPELSPAVLARALDIELGRRLQRPPEYSALKVGGRRAYALARAGEAVELAERPVEVTELELRASGPRLVRVRLRVSKGYYVRSFARDLCETLGLPGHLSALRRTRSGNFDIDEAAAWPPGADLAPCSLADAARRALPAAILTEHGVIRARHGKTLSVEHFELPPEGDGVAAWFDSGGALVALGVRDGDALRVRRGFEQD